MKIIVMALCLFSFTLFSQQAFADSHSGKVIKINLYGGDWGNSWKGGMLYKLDTMPAGTSYFSVRSADIAFDQFYAMLLGAQHAKSTVTVTYNADSLANGSYVATLAISGSVE